jgi:CBS domain-containing protein
MHVHDLLAAKGHDVVTVGPDTSVALAVSMLRTHGIGALVVSGDGSSVDGILSERDIVRALGSRGDVLLALRVADVMTRAVTTCSPDDSVKRVMAQMTQLRVRHLPVVRDGRLVGIVSIGDVVKNRLEEMELETGVLRDAYRAVH